MSENNSISEGIFVPIIVSTDNSKYYFKTARCIGLYLDLKTALHAIIDSLVKTDKFNYEMFVDGLEEDKVLTKAEYINMLKSKVETLEDLMTLCNTYGDTYYSERFSSEGYWNFVVQKLALQ
jgi:hypothetical protein